MTLPRNHGMHSCRVIFHVNWLVFRVLGYLPSPWTQWRSFIGQPRHMIWVLVEVPWETRRGYYSTKKAVAGRETWRRPRVLSKSLRSKIIYDVNFGSHSPQILGLPPCWFVAWKGLVKSKHLPYLFHKCIIFLTLPDVQRNYRKPSTTR